MVNMTLAIPLPIHKAMKLYPEIRWTEVARQAIERKIRELQEENCAWRRHAQEHAVGTGWSEAHELFEF